MIPSTVDNLALATFAGDGPPPSRGCVVAEPGRAPHEVASAEIAAQRLSALLDAGMRVPGAASGRARAPYRIPLSTLLHEEAAALGIADETAFWGGSVPHAFVGTKLVSHPVWPDAKVVPLGWLDIPGVDACTLPGYSVFSHEDAWAAGCALLRDGAIRLKSPFARGGHGQSIVAGEAQFAEWLQGCPQQTLAEGLVLERHLVRSVTFSVGESSVPGHEIAYVGTQRATVDGGGAWVYGGSRLRVRRGGMEAMADAAIAGRQSLIRAAARFDRLVREAYGVVASRRNYDVIAGIDTQGNWRMGVLEQSWRFGGASMAEVLAMERLAEAPALPHVVAETLETYDGRPLPADAVVTWRGGDGSPAKCARIVGTRIDGRRA
jgi:hypothetical protein